jgi:uncharacterized protein
MKSYYNYKSVPIEIAIKDIDTEKNIVTGYANAFNNKDSMSEIVRPGAFEKTIREWGPGGKNRIVHLYQHNPTTLLGKPVKLEEDETGLYFESKIAKTALGKDVLALYEERVINEHSIGYDVVKDYFDKESETRELLELKLFEYSSVTWGANDQTPFTGFASMNPIKSEHYAKVIEQIQALERALKRNLTDETAIQLEIGLQQLRQAFVNISKAMKEPSHSDTPVAEPSQSGTQSEEALIQMLKNSWIYQGRN